MTKLQLDKQLKMWGLPDEIHGLDAKNEYLMLSELLRQELLHAILVHDCHLGEEDGCSCVRWKELIGQIDMNIQKIESEVSYI